MYICMYQNIDRSIDIYIEIYIYTYIYNAQRWGAQLIPQIKLACQKIYKGQSCPKAPPLGSPW